MKYCVDCQFLVIDPKRTENDALEFAVCGHPAAQKHPKSDRFVSPVFDTPPEQKYASIFRAFGECGEDAKLFEPKP